MAKHNRRTGVPVQELVAGAAGGIAGTIATAPMDIVGTRQQVTDKTIAQNIRDIWREGVSASRRRATRSRQFSLFDPTAGRKAVRPSKLRDMIGGTRAFFRGTLPRATKVGPATAIAFGGAEVVRRQLQKHSQHEPAVTIPISRLRPRKLTGEDWARATLLPAAMAGGASAAIGGSPRAIAISVIGSGVLSGGLTALSQHRRRQAFDRHFGKVAASMHADASGSEAPQERFGDPLITVPFTGEAAGHRFVRLFKQAQKLSNEQLLEEIDRIDREKAPQEVLPYVYEAKERNLNLPPHIRRKYNQYATPEFLDKMEKAFRPFTRLRQAAAAGTLGAAIATPAMFAHYTKSISKGAPKKYMVPLIAAGIGALGATTRVQPMLKRFTQQQEEKLFKGAQQRTRMLGKIFTRNPEGVGRLAAGKKPGRAKHYTSLDRKQRKFVRG